MPRLHPLRSIIVNYSPDDQRISVYGVDKAKTETITAGALEAPIFLEEEAHKEGAEYKLDDEFARRLGVAMLNVLALSYPDLRPLITATNAPLPRKE
jgi:hypothetical protein